MSQPPDVPPRFAADQFHSRTVGSDVLMPLCAPDALSNDSALLQHLAYTAESGLGRIVAARLQGEQHPPALTTVFSSHLAAVLLSMAQEGKGIAWLPHTLAEQDNAGTSPWKSACSGRTRR